MLGLHRPLFCVFGGVTFSSRSFRLQSAGGIQSLGLAAMGFNGSSQKGKVFQESRYKGTLMGTPNREPQENSRNIIRT